MLVFRVLLMATECIELRSRLDFLILRQMLVPQKDRAELPYPFRFWRLLEEGLIALFSRAK